MPAAGWSVVSYLYANANKAAAKKRLSKIGFRKRRFRFSLSFRKPGAAYSANAPSAAGIFSPRSRQAFAARRRVVSSG